jgi:hypothetical protein
MRSAVLGAFLLGALAQTPSHAGEGDIAADCQRDLEVLPAYLLANDAGGRAAWDRFGEKHFDEGMEQALTAMKSVTDSAGCVAVLRSYLKSWRDGHLWVYDKRPHASSPDDETPPPRVEWLSASTALLVFPSFDGAERESVEKLFQENRAKLAHHANWIVDVRGNGGGSDSTYMEILRWIGPASRVEVQVEYWSTAANIEAAKQACVLLGAGDDQCEPSMRAERERMQSVPASTWVRQQPGAAVVDVRQEEREPVRPQRVAILVDGGCKSSCEEFLLAARQSFTVKLLGQHTGGTLDYSNLRPYTLPSGDRVLLYAVTRSLRIPAMPVDGIGVMPDVFVPVGGDLVKSALRWLAGGLLAH